MTHDDLDPSTTIDKRPMFLTILCVLTFIGSGIGLFNGLMGMLGATFLNLFTPLGDVLSQSLAIFAAALCLLGAFQMWRLKNQGFWLYLVGGVVSSAGVVIHVLSFNTSLSGLNSKLENLDAYPGELGSSVVTFASGLMWLTVIFTVVVNLGFILMYYANKDSLVK